MKRGGRANEFMIPQRTCPQRPDPDASRSHETLCSPIVHLLYAHMEESGLQGRFDEKMHAPKTTRKGDLHAL
jgi:hypothetical protein